MPVAALILVPTPIALAVVALETPALFCLYIAAGLHRSHRSLPANGRRER